MNINEHRDKYYLNNMFLSVRFWQIFSMLNVMWNSTRIRPKNPFVLIILGSNLKMIGLITIPELIRRVLHPTAREVSPISLFESPFSHCIQGTSDSACTSVKESESEISISNDAESSSTDSELSHVQEEFKDIHDLLQTNSMTSSVSGSESQSTKQLQICQCGCKTVQTCHVVSRKLQTCQCLTMSFQPGLQCL